MLESFTRWRIALALCGGLVALVGAANAQEAKWRFNSVFVEQRQEAKWYQAFADRINKQAAGKLNVTVYHGGSLGLKDVDVIRVLPAGAAELWAIIPAVISRDAPEIANAYPTGIILNPADHERAINALKSIYTDFFTSKGLVVVGFQQSTVFSLAMFCRDKPAKSLDDLKGRKIRVYSKEFADSFKKLGVAAQVIPQNDMYMAMSTGVVDCAVYAYSSAKTISLNEVTKYASDFIAYPSAPQVVLANKKAWDALSPDVQKIVKDSADQMLRESTATMLDFSVEKAAEDEFRAKGFTVVEPFPQADRERFRKAAMESWLESSRETGPAAVANREKIISAMGIPTN